MLTTNKLKMLRGIVGLLTATMLLNACTAKKKSPSLPEDNNNNIIAITDINNKNYAVEISAEAKSINSKASLKASNEKSLYEVVSKTVPAGLNFLVKSLLMSGKAGQAYDITFTVNEKALIAYKTIEASDEKELSTLESLIAIRKNNKILVPLYSVPVEEHGIIVNVKNENKEKTSNLTLEARDWNNSTHIKISNSLKSRKLVITPETTKELYRVSDLNNSILTGTQIRKELGVDADEAIFNDTNKFLLKLDSTGLSIYKITSKKNLSELTVIGNSETLACTADVLAQVDASLKDDCIMILSHKVNVAYVKPEMNEVESASGNNILDGSVNLDKKTNFNPNTIVKIEENSYIEEIAISNILNPKKTLKIKDLLSKEFLFRRTVEDGSNSSNFLPTGFSGDTEIVKFALEENRLVVKKVTSLIQARENNSLDKEELMSIPARFFILQEKDASGQRLAVPRLQAAEYDVADYVYLDWTNNTLPIVKSPLEFFGAAGSCIGNVANEVVSSMDNKLDKGSINFTVSRSFSIAPTAECYNFYTLNDYWYGSQGQIVYSADERISFVEHKASDDQFQSIHVPFAAQNAMGFGGFTIGQRKVNEAGNSGFDGLQDSRPVIHDIQNGKTINYILGGLPTDQKEREIIVRATQKVIAQWNAAFHESFAGTALDREGDYITLQINGEDGAPKGHLGDLDKSYIWNFTRTLETGPLGLAQAAANPRTGGVISSNVMMYGGNLLQYLDSEQKKARVILAYQQRKAAVKAQLLEDKKKQSEENDAEEVISEVSDANNGVIQGLEILNNKPSLLSNVPKNHKKMGLSTQSLKAAMKAQVLTKKNAWSDVKTDAASKSTLFVKSVKEKALELGITGDLRELEALAEQEYFSSHFNKLTNRQKETAAAKIRENALKSKFKKYFASRPGCLTEAAPNLTDVQHIAETDLFELYEVAYTNVLAHEIGHTLGLTHNFLGSTDKANFRHDESGKAINETSTTMDYYDIALDVIDQGIGLYDVYAIRALYTGLVEVADPDKVPEKYKNSIQNKRFVDVETYRQIVAELSGNASLKKSWIGFNASAAQSTVPLRPMKYCTDKDLAWEPLCRQWDRGTTAQEVVQNTIANYKLRYAWTNSAADREVFDVSRTGSYIARLEYDFMNIRQFMEESIYRAIIGDRESMIDHAYASLNALDFFTELALTPDAAGKSFENDGRFTLIDYKYQNLNPSTGAPEGELISDIALVEAKSTGNLGTASVDRLDTFGIEYDKILALLSLTQRDPDNFKYAQMNLSFSYIDFEAILLGQDPAQTSAVSLIYRILSNQMVSLVSTDNAGLVDASAAGLPTITSDLRYYALFSGLVLSETNATEDTFNYASLFRVGSTLNKPPTDRVVIAESGSQLNSQVGLKFFAMDNASIANSMIESIAPTRFIIDSNEKLTELLTPVVQAIIADKDISDDQRKAIIKISNPVDPSKSVELRFTEKEKVAILKAAKKVVEFDSLGLIESKENLAKNKDLMVQRIAMFSDVIKGDIKILGILIEQKKSPFFSLLLQRVLQQKADNLAMDPLLLPIFQAEYAHFAALFKDSADELNIIEQLYAADKNNLNASISEILSNVKLMNMFFYMMNPNYNK